MFAIITAESKSVREKILNLDRITHIEVFPSGGSTVNFGDENPVRLGLKETQVLLDAIKIDQQPSPR